ncbi:FHA domain-containing protein, partial [Myxococcus sp. AM010]|nr:FHA domain-containing protein [Myxococcus sp. AM010]
PEEPPAEEPPTPVSAEYPMPEESAQPSAMAALKDKGKLVPLVVMGVVGLVFLVLMIAVLAGA